MCKRNLQKGSRYNKMGMAASQARFLGLTARKTNVEYEGQQINQQRTTLANQSANYYNSLLGMSVPAPPSVDSYTKTVYTFNDGALTNTVTALIAQSDGKYTLSYLSSYEDDFSPVAAGTSVVNKAGNDYMVGSVTLRELGVMPNEDVIKKDPYLSTLTQEQIEDLIKEEEQYVYMLNEKYGESDYFNQIIGIGGAANTIAASGWRVRYVQNSDTGTWTPYFYKLDDLENGVTNQNGDIASSVNCYTIGSSTRTTEVKGIKDCHIEKDSTGRYISITIPQEGGGNGVTYSLTTSTVTDQDAYDDAMNQYEYDKYQYDQAIQEINAKIEIIQAQDKNLELRLKQLDTEQDAISTEMDAVEKVIEKNTESSFKTFG